MQKTLKIKNEPYWWSDAKPELVAQVEWPSNADVVIIGAGYTGLSAALTLIDSGQYNKAWQHSHMFPQESVQAAIDLKADFYMPIHWGAFVLSMHHWTEPVEKAKFYADQKKQKIITPQIGQIIKFNQLNITNTNAWWK